MIYQFKKFYPNFLGPRKCNENLKKYNTECSICLEILKVENDYVSFTPCNHLFHHKCLNDYFEKTKELKCPNCNFDIMQYYKNKK